MSRRQGCQYDIAVSFAGEQREYVERVVRACEGSGLRVFYDRDQEVENFGQHVVTRYRKVFGGDDVHYVVIFLSEEYLSKPYPKDEFRAATLQAIQRDDGYLLPVIIGEVKIPPEFLQPDIGYLRVEDYSPEKLAGILTEMVASLRRHHEGSAHEMTAAEEGILRLPQIEPFDFSQYEILQATLGLIAGRFEAGLSELERFVQTTRLRNSDTSVEVRLEERGKKVFSLRVAFDDSFEDDYLAVTFGRSGVLRSDTTVWVGAVWDGIGGRAMLRYIEARTPMGAAGELITDTRLLEILWYKIVRFIEQRGR